MVPGLPDLASLAGATLYAAVVTVVFAESGLLVGFFLPGDTVLFAAGLLTADPRRHLSLPLLVGGVLVAAVAGDAVGYGFGRRAGRPLLARRGDRLLGTAGLRRAEALYARYGGLVVVAARWVPWLRTFTPILAGAARMRYRAFLVANVVGALTWGAGLLLLGHAAAGTAALRRGSGAVALAAVGLSVLAGTARALHRRRGSG